MGDKYDDMIDAVASSPAPDKYDAMIDAVVSKPPTPSIASILTSGLIPNATLLEAARGFTSGIKRQDPAPGFASGIGHAVGRYGLPVAGTIAAGALTGGAGLIPAAAAAGIGGAAGEAYGQLASRTLGGESPETATKAATGIVKTGMGNALMQLGMGVGGKLIETMYPVIAQTFLKLPAESIKRAIKNPEIVPMRGSFAKADVERRGVNALRELQKGIDNARKVSGENVDDALKTLMQKTKGDPVVDMTDVASAADEALQSMGRGDVMIDEAVKSDFGKIKALVDAIRSKPIVDANTAVLRRRTLDNLVAYNKFGIREIGSKPAENVVKGMAHEMRTAIDKAADSVGYAGLKKANNEHWTTMNLVEEFGGLFRTKTPNQMDLLKRFANLTNRFNQGGLSTEIISETGKKFPAVAKQADTLLDSMAARAFTEIPSTPSGSTKDMLMFVGRPLAGRALKAKGTIYGLGQIGGAILSSELANE